MVKYILVITLEQVIINTFLSFFIRTFLSDSQARDIVNVCGNLL